MKVIRPLLASVLTAGLMATGAAPLPAAPVTQSTQMPAVDSPECTIVGTSGADVLVGTPGDDVLCGRGGNDVISGGGGDDVLRGGSGNDELRGEAGDDILGGGRGGDVLQGGAGDDVLQGLDGSDLLAGGKGRDLLKGGDGSDDAAGGPGRDTVRGGASWDDLDGGPGPDRLEGGAGADRLDARDDSSFVDQVDCGTGGLDRARADVEDRVEFSCEKYRDNVGPTGLTLSNGTLSDGRPAGTEVGVLAAVDRNPGDRLTFRLVEGAGGQDNRAFTIDGRSLSTLEPTQADTKKSYSIRVRVTDNWGARQTKNFTISVDATGQPPVTPDDRPTAVDDSATVTEDAAATAVDVLTNDNAGNTGSLSIDSVTQPDKGTVVITGSGIGLTYQPDADYCNDGSPKDTFTYTLRGGSTATVAMTVTCVVDASAAKDDAATVTEDAAATGVDVLANDNAGDTGPLSISSVTQPGDGTVVITGGGAGLTYRPDADYCNDGSPKDTFDYTLNGGSTATVSMTVTCEDDLPTAVADSATVTEDDAATAVDVLANDTDPDGGPRAVDSVTQPGNGTVVITGNGTGLTYRPDADYCNDGSPEDTFDYTLNGGSTATVSMTVTCVVDPAVAVDDSASVTEDAAPTAVDVLANDNAGDTGPLSISSVTQPGDGTVLITGGGTGLTYQPDADYCNGGSPKDTFDYTLNGGSTATVSMTVTCVDDLPTAVADSATVTEDDAATAVDVLANDTDPDGGPRAVDSVTQPDNGTVLITGSGTGLTYRPDADYCNGGSPKDAFTYTLNGGSTATVSMTVTCVDDLPTAVDDAATVTEDAAATAVNVLANDLNADGGPMSIASVTQPDNGTVVITGSGTGLTYQPAVDYCNGASTEDAFTYTLNGGSQATVSVRVTCADDPATAVDDSATVTEDDAATAVDVLANDTDPDGGPTRAINSATQPDNGTVVITGGGTGLTYEPDADYCNGGSPKDTFTYTLNGGSTATVSMTVTCVDDPPTAVDDAATVAEDDAATAVNVLVNDLNADGGPKSIASATQPGDGTVLITGGGTGLTYKPDADYCNGGSPVDTFTYTLNGGSTATVSMTVTCQNDPPIAVDDVGMTDEDTTLTVPAAGVLTNDTDKDLGDTKTVVKLNGSTPLTGTSAKGAAVTIAADGAYTYNPGNIFQGLSTGESDTDSFTYTMEDGAGATSTATVSVTITGVSDAPTANTDSFDAVGNTALFVSVSRPTGKAGRVTTGSVLTNDTDPDTAGNLVVEAVSNAATVRGGRITIKTDGTFSYEPPAGITGQSDSFTYRVCDASPCTSSTVANSTGTLNLPLVGQVWYVDNTAAAGGDGTSGAPFDTLTEAEIASGDGDTTFVFDGDDTSTGLGGGYTLNADERLVGEVVGLTLDPDGAGPLSAFDLYPATAGKRPLLTASNKDVVTLASKSTVTGLGLDPSGSGGGISGGSGVNTTTISDVVINDTGVNGSQPGLDLDATSGTTSISNLSVTTTQATGVRLVNAGTVLFTSAGTVSIVSGGAAGLVVSGTTLTNSEFDSISVTASGNGGVSLSNVTGPTNFKDLSLATSSGAAPAFALSNAGSVTVPAASTATLSATGGPAVDVTGTAGASLAFDSVSSTNSANDGVNIAGLGTGTFSATGGTLTGAQGIAFDLDGGSATVGYAGQIDNGSGASVEVTNRSGGVVTFSGSITDGPDAGGGITLTSNSGATVNMTGAVNLSTGGGAAFTATGGGTVTVTGSPSTLATTTGTALQVANTTIGANGLTFRSISTNGASKGIALDTTGTAGSLTVTGAGGTCTSALTCTGGSIVNSAGSDDAGTSPVGTGIVLKSTKAPSLTRMLIDNASNYAIRGTDVSGFTLANSVITGINGTNGATPFDDAAIRFENLTGSAAITDTQVSGGREDNLSVTNSTGSLDRLTLTRVSIGLNSNGDGNDGLHLESDGTAGALKATIQDSTFTGARGDLVDYSHNGSGEGDLVIDNSDFENNHLGIATGGGGLTLSRGGTGAVTSMAIRNSTFRDAVGAAVLVYKAAGPSVITGAFENNTIGVTGDVNSGSAEGSGLKLQTVGQGTMTWSVTGNDIRGYNNHGIEVLAGGGATATSGNINTTITGNTIAQPGSTANVADFPKNGIHFNIGTVPGDTFATCAVIGGDGILANRISGSGKDGAQEPGSGYDFRLRQRQATTIRLPGYGQANNANAAVQAFVTSRNSADGTPDGQAQNTVPTGGGFTGTGATCP